MTGSWFSLAYTQHDHLALTQIISVTGIWGLSFAIAWFASVVNWAWERAFSPPRIWRGAAIYLGVLAAILLFGGAYLAFLHADSRTVRTAAVTRSFDMDVEARKCDDDVQCEKALFRRALDEFLSDSQRAADAGARIIAWAENGLAVYQEDEASFIEQGRAFAEREGVYLLMGVHMFSQDWSVEENKALLVSPSGEVSTYLKNYLTVGAGHIVGDGTVFMQETPYGKLAVVICKDAEFPAFVRQAGRADADIILIPTANWHEIMFAYFRMTHFRAIENGMSMLRANYHGLSSALDYHGRVLAQMNHFVTDERVMIADLPTEGLPTVYSRIGDLFAWLSIAAFVALVVLAIVKR
jgi:apolipoprotein N-acyltransferase